MLAAYIDEIIMLCAGLWITGVGFGHLSPPGANPMAQEVWRKRFGLPFKIIGPTLLIVAVVLAAATFAGVVPAK